jgi:hypothetical protein
MASYFSSLLTTTTSRVASIRQNLLPSENDGDTDDDTHLCRVLRAYYTEKGRPFPGWLPPDPKAPPPVVVAPVYSQPGVGSRYGGMQTQGGAGGGALSSLWDSQPQGQAQQDPASLRQGRGGPPMRNVGGGPGAQRQNPFMRQQNTQEPQVQARPLPSQRAGSYQTAGVGAYGRGDTQTPPGSSSGPLTARERLKRGLTPQNARAASPSNASPRMVDTVQSVQRANSYGSSKPGGSDNYEDRFAPGGAYGGGGGVGEKPFVAATAPWASNEAEFSGSGYGGGYDSGASRSGARQGLPSGPGAGRRGPGLPSGPRGAR